MAQTSILDKALKDFQKTFKQKTSKAKGYTEIEINFKKDEAKKEVAPVSKEYAPTKLHPQVYNFVKFINDDKAMERVMEEAGYDTKKLPLGNLSEKTVEQGNGTLKELDDIHKKIKKGKTTLSAEMAEIKKLSSKFYTIIPHNFGYSKMHNFILDSEDKVKSKFELISNL